MGVISIKPRRDRVYNEQEKWDDFREKSFVELATTGFHMLAFTFASKGGFDVDINGVDITPLVNSNVWQTKPVAALKELKI